MRLWEQSYANGSPDNSYGSFCALNWAADRRKASAPMISQAEAVGAMPWVLSQGRRNP
ncbi:hypothetical protein SAMN05216345_104212 [Cupriavidus sp. YR651]|nr:hypothetical protein SAMN05216345_104212 [Cupriavidus sp. YR651]